MILSWQLLSVIMISFSLTVARTIDTGAVDFGISEEQSETEELFNEETEELINDDVNDETDSIVEGSESQVIVEDDKIDKPSTELYCPPCIRDSHQNEERSVESLGWAAATAILIFAFSNTVIVGATLVISYILYQVVITALAVMAPGVAAVFIKFASLFSFI